MPDNTRRNGNSRRDDDDDDKPKKKPARRNDDDEDDDDDDEDERPKKKVTRRDEDDDDDDKPKKKVSRRDDEDDDDDKPRKSVFQSSRSKDRDNDDELAEDFTRRPPRRRRRRRRRTGRVNRSGSNATAVVIVPAIGLIVLASIHLLVAIFGLIVSVSAFAGAPIITPSKDETELTNFFNIIGGVIALFVQSTIAYGGWQMARLGSHGMAHTACVLSCIPIFCSSCGILGIPFGIWGLIALQTDTVQREMG